MRRVGRRTSLWKGIVHRIHRKSCKEHAVIMESRGPHCDFKIGAVRVAGGETRELIGFVL